MHLSVRQTNILECVVENKAFGHTVCRNRAVCFYWCWIAQCDVLVLTITPPPKK